jgi:hypothetical protein
MSLRDGGRGAHFLVFLTVHCEEVPVVEDVCCAFGFFEGFVGWCVGVVVRGWHFVCVFGGGGEVGGLVGRELFERVIGRIWWMG